LARILITGVAGFIGSHLAGRLLAENHRVVGVDNLNDYYDVRLKRSRLDRLSAPGFHFVRMDLADRIAANTLFAQNEFDIVYHMAAQAGVRHSLTHPHSYVDSNLTAFVNVLEGCRISRPQHLVYASSSSVYGANGKTPFAVGDPVDHPINLYAATKRANELMAFTYSHLYQLPTTGLRFFTVYGPWGRPDMAIYKFTEAILQDRPIEVHNAGRMSRDFTYIDDIVEGVMRVGRRPPLAGQSHEPANSCVPAKLYNIGNNDPIELDRLIQILEETLGKPAIKKNVPLQAGEMTSTYADIQPLAEDIGFQPSTSIESGVEKFVAWYRWYQASGLKTSPALASAV
jgi:UDP-glucuronate 4-epimerase